MGEVRARPGTSTAELAGAVKHWHTRYQEACEKIWEGRRHGFVAGSALILMLDILAVASYYLLSK